MMILIYPLSLRAVPVELLMKIVQSITLILCTLSSFVYLETNPWVFDKVSQNLLRDLMTYIFYGFFINLKMIEIQKKVHEIQE